MVKWLKINRIFLTVSESFYTVFTSCTQIVRLKLSLTVEALYPNLARYSSEYWSTVILILRPTSEIVVRVSRAVGICNKLVIRLSFYILRKLLFILIYPFATSGVEIWGHSPSVQLKKLYTNIYKSMKLIDNERFFAVNYKKNSTLPLAKICQYFSPVRVFKYYRLNKSRLFYFFFWLSSSKTPPPYEI